MGKINHENTKAVISQEEVLKSSLYDNNHKNNNIDLGDNNNDDDDQGICDNPSIFSEYYNNDIYDDCDGLYDVLNDWEDEDISVQNSECYSHDFDSDTNIHNDFNHNDLLFEDNNSFITSHSYINHSSDIDNQIINKEHNQYTNISTYIILFIIITIFVYIFFRFKSFSHQNNIQSKSTTNQSKSTTDQSNIVSTLSTPSSAPLT